MLLDHAQQPAAADRVRAAVNATLAANVFPKDLGGQATTTEITKAILNNL
jgi:isocitrate/isopropylmalate dehydrogenase